MAEAIYSLRNCPHTTTRFHDFHVCRSNTTEKYRSVMIHEWNPMRRSKQTRKKLITGIVGINCHSPPAAPLTPTSRFPIKLRLSTIINPMVHLLIEIFYFATSCDPELHFDGSFEDFLVKFGDKSRSGCYRISFGFSQVIPRLAGHQTRFCFPFFARKCFCLFSCNFAPSSDKVSNCTSPSS